MTQDKNANEKNRLLIAFPDKSVQKVKRMLAGKGEIRWLYFGHDFFKRRAIEECLGALFSRIDIAKHLDSVASEIRLEHVLWIDELNRRYGDNNEWWFGFISSRNIYDSDLFLNCCYLEIVKRLWDETDAPPFLIICESAGLAKSIRKMAVARNRDVAILSGLIGRFKYKQKRYAYLFLSWCKFIVTSLLCILSAYMTRCFNSRKVFSHKPLVIIDTFVHNYSLLVDGTFKDRYFPHLHQYLSDKGRDIVVHPVLCGFGYQYFSIFNRMRKSSTNFIIKEDYLHVGDYLTAISYPLRFFLRRIEATPFRGDYVDDIIVEEKRNHRSFASAMLAVLIHRLFLRLKKSALNPVLVIDWYENQVIDKALISGIRKAFPMAKIIGAQMFIAARNFLNIYPSQSEIEAGVTPDILLETSKYQCGVAQMFTKDIPCAPAAALRYSYVFDKRDRFCTEVTQKEAWVLITLPFDISESMEILETVSAVMDQMCKSIRIFIKCHPDYTPDKMVKVFGPQKWPRRFEICTVDMAEALNSASLVISSNSSSMVEAAARGIPVIFLGRQTSLNQNILSNLNMEIVTECFSVKDLVIAINKYLTVHPDKIKKYQEMGNKIRDLFFTPVNEETMQPFL